jgi:hypothetical protein
MGMAGLWETWRSPAGERYRRIILVAALILGSHALHDSFAVIRWRAAGIGPGTAGLLWSLSVAAVQLPAGLGLRGLPHRRNASRGPAKSGCVSSLSYSAATAVSGSHIRGSYFTVVKPSDDRPSSMVIKRSP